MGIHVRSELFVGAAYRDINCESWILDNECPEDMDESVFDDMPYIERISPSYDAPSASCYYGVTVTCDEIMAPGGIQMVNDLITQMNDLLKTTKCKLMHSANVT